MLKELEMRLFGGVHEETDLLDDTGYVRSCDGKVLKSPD
jgi:hypothetical protein